MIPIVAVHGYGDTPAVFDPMRQAGLPVARAPHLAWGAWRAVAWQPHHGVSELADVLNTQAGKSPYAVLAHGLGAAATLVAARPANAPQVLVLLCPLLRPPPARGEGHGAARAFHGAIAQRLLLAAGGGDRDVHQWLTWLVARGTARHELSKALHLSALASTVDVGATASRVLAVTGGKDTLSPSTPRQFQVGSPGAVRHTHVPVWGHFAHIERPRAVARMVAAWMEARSRETVD